MEVIYKRCGWIGGMLKRIGKIPRVIITDGLASYRYLIMEGVRHVLCHFHHQQGITRWLKKRFDDKDEIISRSGKMKRVLQTNDKRTVRRRLRKLKESAQELGISEWVQRTEEKLPQLLPSVEVSFCLEPPMLLSDSSEHSISSTRSDVVSFLLSVPEES